MFRNIYIVTDNFLLLLLFLWFIISCSFFILFFFLFLLQQNVSVAEHTNRFHQTKLYLVVKTGTNEINCFLKYYYEGVLIPRPTPISKCFLYTSSMCINVMVSCIFCIRVFVSIYWFLFVPILNVLQYLHCTLHTAHLYLSEKPKCFSSSGIQLAIVNNAILAKNIPSLFSHFSLNIIIIIDNCKLNRQIKFNSLYSV